LFELEHRVHETLRWWVGDPTPDRIAGIIDSIPELKKLVDANELKQRFDPPNVWSSDGHIKSLAQVFPELAEIRGECVNAIRDLPNGVSKAEWCLTPIARDCGADADVEAAIYFASRGKLVGIGIEEIRRRWHSSICFDVLQRTSASGSQELQTRAKEKTLSLAEAADVLLDRSLGGRFFSFRDEEEDFIDSSFVRAAEWLNIGGFERWLQSAVEPLSIGPKYLEGQSEFWWLFFFCRSDLALRTAERHGLEAWFWSLSQGEVERGRPWRVFWSRNDGKPRDYLPSASILLFAWKRIAPQGLKEDTITEATQLLLSTQMNSGAWPLLADNAKPDLISTCFAIHGLALTRPAGWISAVKRAGEWIRSQQDAFGLWHVDGGPAIMLTVLALDAIELAAGGTKVTFRVPSVDAASVDVCVLKSSKPGVIADPVYDYSKEPWYSATPPEIAAIAFSNAARKAKPTLAFVVATETELRQVLRVLRPLPNQRRVWRSSRGHETYYLDRLGAFRTVVLLSSMGSHGPTSATLSIASLIEKWKPVAIVLVGIAFGASRNKHLPADVLVSEHLIPYESQRLGEKIQFRNPVPPSSPILVNRFRHALDWKFLRPDGSQCRCHIGPLLSGEKLIDDNCFKESLLEQYPNAIGGEMEGTGLWASSSRDKKDWIVVKGVCDWADGNKNDAYQMMAAASAVSLCLHVFRDPGALDGV